METAVIAKPDFQFFIRRLLENHHVEGVKRKGQSVFGQAYFYGPIEHPDDLCLDFDCTAMPPKKYFLPPREELLHFTTQPTLSASAAMEIKELILIGVHPYDIKAITQMDKPIRNRIIGYLKQLEALNNPRIQGKALTGKYSGLWRYRVGDYRLICQIKDKEIIILVLDIDHRKDIYK